MRFAHWVTAVFIIVAPLGCGSRGDLAAGPSLSEEIPPDDGGGNPQEGVCVIGGDDLAATADWDEVSACASAAGGFSGQRVTVGLIDQAFWQADVSNVPEPQKYVYFVHGIEHINGVQQFFWGPSHLLDDYSSFATMTITVTLGSHLDGLRIEGFLGACPAAIASSGDACATWAFSNDQYHDEPELCISNPAGGVCMLGGPAVTAPVGSLNIPPVAAIDELMLWVCFQDNPSPYCNTGNSAYDSYDPDGSIVIYRWNLANGQTVETQTPGVIPVQYLQNMPPSVVRLTVFDDAGGFNTAERIVQGPSY